MATPAEPKKGITPEQQQELDEAFARARKALAVIETYDQARVDRLCQAVAWAVANKRTFTRLVDMGIAGIRARRSGEPHGQADEDPRRAARRAAPEERRRDRGAAGEGDRQVRQAGRRHRLHRADDQPGPHARRQRDLRDQGARRRHLLAAPALEEDVVRDRAPDARGARARRRAGRHPAVPDEGEHPDVAGADGARGPDHRHRAASRWCARRTARARRRTAWAPATRR